LDVRTGWQSAPTFLMNPPECCGNQNAGRGIFPASDELTHDAPSVPSQYRGRTPTRQNGGNRIQWPSVCPERCTVCSGPAGECLDGPAPGRPSLTHQSCSPANGAGGRGAAAPPRELLLSQRGPPTPGRLQYRCAAPG